MRKDLWHLREAVLKANLALVDQGLVISTFGNVSGILRDEETVVIKPSGVPYSELTVEKLVATRLSGEVVEGDLRPSSDLATHLALYRAFPEIGGVAHTHSRYATAWSQAGREIPCLGTTHADYFHGPVPVTEWLTPAQIADHYEANTGKVIARRFRERNPLHFPGVLVAGHGPFAWGDSAAAAAEMALMVEEIARIAFYTLTLEGATEAIPRELHDKHFLRKHGPKAYYGQKPHDG